MTRTRTRVAAATALATAATLALAGPASAHVSIDPGEAEQGGYDTINIKVPNERDDASTTRLELHLDQEHPIASVMPQPVPGWEVEVTTRQLEEPLELHGSEITEVPDTVTWTGGSIDPGTFQQFPLSVGRLPEDADRLVLDAIQTYDSGEVVRWIEEPVEGEEEPEHPSPVLQLVPAAEGAQAPAEEEAQGAAANSAGAGDTEAAEDAESAAAGDGGGDASDGTARLLGGIGIALGVAGLAYGVIAGRRRA